MSKSPFDGMSRREFLAKVTTAGGTAMLASWASPTIEKTYAATATHFTDDFNRANSSSLGTNWTARGTGLVIYNDTACAGSTSVACSTYVNAMTTDHHRISVVVGQHTAGGAFVFYVRANTSQQMVGFFSDGVNGPNIEIGWWNGTFQTAPAGVAAGSGHYHQKAVAPSPGFTTGDTLSFEAAGPNYCLKKNGTTVCTWMDAYTTPQYNYVNSSHRYVGLATYWHATHDGFDSCAINDIPPFAGDGNMKSIQISTDIQPNQTWFHDAYAAGFEIFQCDSTNTDRTGANTAWTPTPTLLGYALNAGMKIAAYSRNPAIYSIGIKACAPYVSQLNFWIIDVEDNTGTGIPNYGPLKQSWINGVTALGVRPVIYSGNWCWVTVEGSDVQTFHADPLYDSCPDDGTIAPWRTDYPANLLAPQPNIFGGWNTATTFRKGVQQCLDVKLNGYSVDVSTWDRAWINAGP